MEIVDVSFKNFSRIYSGLGKQHLYINFEDMPYAIFLFIGENGSGKTSILRALHPFAYNGSAGDNTANSDLIMEGKDGEKQITIRHGEYIYHISHIYSRKKDKSISLKSYIQENGVELNDSGTVKTFKEIVLDKLGLDETFLGLLSLGNTIDGFVKYTSANRKKFSTQIFSQLGIYSKYYKTVGMKVRDTKSVLSNVTSKLERYKSYNVEELELHKIELEAEVCKLKETLNSITMNIGSSMQIIRDNESFIETYDQKKEEFNQLLQSIDSLKRKISTQKDLITLKNDLNSITEKVNTVKVTVSGIEASLKSQLDIRDAKVSTMKTLSENVKRMSNNANVTELTELKASLEANLSEIVSKNLPPRPQWSKEDLIKINIYLDELRGMCIDLVNDVTNLNIIPKILKDYLKDSSIEKSISRSYGELKYAYNRSKSFILTKSILDSMKIRKLPLTCDINNTNCPYVEFHDRVMATIANSVEENNKELQSQRELVDETEDMLKAVTIIKKLYSFIQMNAKYFDLPDSIFNEETFILQYLGDRTTYDADLLSSIIELEETYEQKEHLEEKIRDIDEKLESLTDTSLYDDMVSQINSLNESISDLDKMMEQQRSDLKYNNSQLIELTSILEDVKKQVNLLTELDQERNKFNSVKSELSLMESKMQGISDAQEKCKEYEIQQNAINLQIVDYNEKLKNTDLMISTILNLQKEQRELIEKYSKDKLILEALSPTTGIPLEFINYYIKEEMIGKVNELLNKVYHGRLKLLKSKTIINEDEFTIPYVKRNTVVADISKASDGEKAIISLAFSLVLLNITAGPYNILLLDEMDTTLDTTSRSKYIELLEQFMKTIKAEQLFLISHNSMFDVYPVNVLMTSRTVVNMEHAHIKDLTA